MSKAMTNDDDAEELRQALVWRNMVMRHLERKQCWRRSERTSMMEKKTPEKKLIMIGTDAPHRTACLRRRARQHVARSAARHMSASDLKFSPPAGFKRLNV